MIKISWIVAWLIASGLTLFGFVLCALLVGRKLEEEGYRDAPTTPPPKSRKAPDDLPCSHALHCPMANDVYCAECDSRQLKAAK